MRYVAIIAGVLALMAPMAAEAQVSALQQEYGTPAPQHVDPSTCKKDRELGTRMFQCPDGLYEWQRINRRSVLVKVQVISDPYQADAMRRIEEDRSRSYRPYRPSVNCYVNALRFTDVCIEFRKTDEYFCTGPYSHRYVESTTCIRWRAQAYGRSY